VTIEDMGAGVSVQPLSKTDLEKLCVNEDSQRIDKIWTSLKSSDDTIDSSQFFHIANDDLEREALSLFLCFGDGEVTKEQFINFCVHSKLLSKKKFSRSAAETLFDENCKGNSSVNYVTIRFEVIPIIAKACDKYVRDVIRKLSHVEEPPPPLSHQSSGSNMCATNSASESDEDRLNDIITRAVIRIQNLLRIKRSYLELLKERELKRLEQLEAEHRAKVEFEDMLDDCERIFNQICPTGRMDMRDLVRLCFDTEIIPYGSNNVDFTSGDAKFIFKKVVAMHFDPADRLYKNGVICGKRFVFEVFRNEVIPELARAKRVSVKEMAELLATSSGVPRVRVEGKDEGKQLLQSALSSSFLDNQIKDRDYGNCV
jgi:hypothetical protein